jgi:hypothetical protein
MTTNNISNGEMDFLESQIKGRYGSIRTFTSKTDLPYRRTLDLFNKLEYTEDFFNKVKGKFYESKHIPEMFGRINEPDRESIRICILTNFRSATAFCKKHKKFDNVYVSNIISGRLKLSTPKYRKLVSVLEKKYELLIEE